MLKNLQRRKPKGQSMVVLIVFLIVFFILLLGMTAFEFARYSLCCQQFQHCVDIAALGGAAGLASAQTTDQAAAQSAAIQTAQWMMERNYILEVPLAGRTTWSAGATIPTMPATKNRANMAFTWVNPETGAPTAVPGDQKVFRVSGCYSYPPLVGSWIGLGNNTLGAVVAIGNGGGTMLDVALCFDLSGSIDDSTNVTLVERTSNAVGQTQYRPVTNGPLYTACGCTFGSNPTGTSLNVCYPQRLEESSNVPYGQYSYQRRGNTQGQRAPFASPAGGETFTDIVVNLNEGASFVGGSYGGLNFPNIGSLVEASRGNLESITIANNASVNYAGLGVTPTQGYYRTYWEQAQLHRHPLYDAQASAANFFQIINNSTNAHFCFIAFTDGEDPDTFTQTYNSIANNQNTHSISTLNAGNIPVGPTVFCPVPYVPLSNVAGAAGSQFTQVQSYLPLAPALPATVTPQLTATSLTDINGSLTLALQNFLKPAQISGGLDQKRAGAKTAIVLFTDGLPTANTGIGNQNGTDMAAVAAANGVQIYCIGLAQTAALVPTMTTTLNNISNPTGGKLYIIPPGTGQAAALNRAFSDIARSLVSLTR